MTFSRTIEGSHAPYKDQIDDETVLFELDNSMDATSDTQVTVNFDNDSDTQRSQTNQSSCTGGNSYPRKESRLKSDNLLSRVGSSASIDITVKLEDIYEYEWADSDCESLKWQNSKDSYIVQEILADYLQIKSFKRKYPDLSRRTMDAYERSWLQQEGIVPTGGIDLGLTALKTDEVMSLLQQDYSEVHIALTDIFRRRKFHIAAELQKRQYEAARIERGEARAEAARRRAVHSASDFNHQLISDRLTKRRCYWDLQTMQIHIPQRIYKLFNSSTHSNGAYPVAVIPGQFAEFYVNYTPEQLFHLPLSRVAYPQPLRTHKLPPQLPTNLRFGQVKPRVVTGGSSVSDANEVKSNGILENNLAGDIRFPNTSLLSDEAQRIKNATPKYQIMLDSSADRKSNSEMLTCSICTQPAPLYLRCSECKLIGHSRCLDVPDSMLPGVRSYAWCCMECKRCMNCNDSGHEDQMMFCDVCDRGYHAFCVGLNNIPDGKWECSLCISQLALQFSKKRRYQKTTHKLAPTSEQLKRPRGRPRTKNRTNNNSVFVGESSLNNSLVSTPIFNRTHLNIQPRVLAPSSPLPVFSTTINQVGADECGNKSGEIFPKLDTFKTSEPLPTCLTGSNMENNVSTGMETKTLDATILTDSQCANSIIVNEGENSQV